MESGYQKSFSTNQLETLQYQPEVYKGIAVELIGNAVEIGIFTTRYAVD